MGAERAQLITALTAHAGVANISDREIAAILDLAAVAAHGTGDRTSAPIASFIAGLVAAGNDDRLAAIATVRERAAAATSESR